MLLITTTSSSTDTASPGYTSTTAVELGVSEPEKTKPTFGVRIHFEFN